jgi:hypothetical protein
MRNEIYNLIQALNFGKCSPQQFLAFFAVVNAFFNFNFPHSLWQKNCVLNYTAIALSALVKFEPCDWLAILMFYGANSEPIRAAGS